MDYALPAAVFLGIPVFMLLMFKSNIGIMFLAACTGIVLLGSLDQAVVTAAGSVVPGEGEAYVRLAVVVAAMCFAGFIFRGKVKGTMLPLNAIICLLLSLTLWLTLPAVTGVSWLTDGSTTEPWQQLNDFETLIIASGFLLSLISILLTRPHEKHKKSKH